MHYIFDIDKTILETHGNDYYTSVPIVGRISRVNALFAEGHRITYYTARGGNSGKDWEEFTRNQLNIFGCYYDELKMKKPSYDLWVDDKSVHSDDFFMDN